ncbi:DUF599 domain-containing protein [Limobrevibacterium gyesilva]|uniref:DUF599 family protein n=1 Tax=Limobrevibacterium gyesilva TaxID=2991712 RepID=A0AA42CGS9_9PROT|nr:DUF599 family protein [Limobrevibacterium gyesilva]MCW3474287.1 DUF599 family protein [Limobrevibacterium gyesilva]
MDQATGIFHLFPPGDLTALAVFCLIWLGYGHMVRWFGQGSINAGLHTVRVLWMRSMLMRDNRITDSSLIGHVVHSASFFASTSLIAIGALLGVLTGLDRLQPTVEGLALSVPASRQLLEIKVLLPLAVLVHGMFKLTWALRQLNYTVALIGAMPPAPIPEPLCTELADHVGGVLSSALATFNDGIRAYYFALVGLSWLAGPWVLVVAVLWLMAVLLFRQFGSTVAARFGAARRLVEAAHGRPPVPGPGDGAPR